MTSGCDVLRSQIQEFDYDEPEEREITRADWAACLRLCGRSNMGSVIVRIDGGDTLDCRCKDLTEITIRRYVP